MFKRRSPKEVIESVDKPELEEAWAKLPREEPKPIGTNRKKNEVSAPYPFVERGTLVHTHPYTNPIYKTPSSSDYYDFLFSLRRKMVVAQTNPENGKLMGYFVVRKTKKTIDRKPIPHLLIDLLDTGLYLITFGFYRGHSVSTDFVNAQMNYGKDGGKDFDKLMSKYHLQYKYLPVKGTTEESKVEKSSKASLENKIVFISVVGLILSIFFLSSNLTGNVIGNLNQTSSNWIGGVLFLIGLVGAFAYFKKR